MSKHRKKKQSPTPKSPPSRERIPSPTTLFRMSVRDDQSREAMNNMAVRLGPMLWQRDGKIIEQIKNAETLAQVLDLASQAHGLGESAWMARVRQFGLAAVPLIKARLQASHDITDEDARDTARERLIAALRWNGLPGARALQDCFADLDEYAQCLACVVLGLLHAASSADLMWAYYQKMKDRPQSYFVGALWGLIDLKDERAGRALAELASEEGRLFFELFGLIALAGDARVVGPLVSRMLDGSKDVEERSMIALAAVAQRIGRQALVAEFEKMSASDVEKETLESTADRFLSYPLSDVQEYFHVYYQGIRSDDLNV